MPPKVKVPFRNNSPKSNYQNHQNKLDNLKNQNHFSQNLEQNNQRENPIENIDNSSRENKVLGQVEKIGKNSEDLVTNSQNNSQNYSQNSNLETPNSPNSPNSPNMQNNTPNENSKNSDITSNSTLNSSIPVSNLNPNFGTNSTNFSKDAEIEKLQKEIIDLKSKNEEITNRIFRMAADAQNSSKQEEINLAQNSKKTKKSVVNLILPFLDTLNLAFAFVPETSDEKMQKFFQTLQKSFEKLIVDLNFGGIELIIPKENDVFDPQIMTPLNSPELQEENQTENVKIKRMVSIGVKIDGQVIRSASIMF